MKNRIFFALLTAIVLNLHSASNASEVSREDALKATSAAVLPAMEKNQIPGIAVGLVIGEKTYIFNYGMMEAEEKQAVKDSTIFEIGSISKTFTATLASYAEAAGKLQLSGTIAKHLPELAGSNFGELQLIHLGTHTTGGMPLQVPDEIQNKEQLLEYFRNWKPEYKAGTVRTYANPSIGTLGWIAAESLGQDFSVAVNQNIFQPLGLENSYFIVPAHKMKSYAWGYTRDKKPVRVNPGLLDFEAYGIKTTATDLATFLKANMGMLSLDKKLQEALRNTRKGYFKVGEMTQDLIWEEYAMPVSLQALQEGSSSTLILNSTPVSANIPPTAPLNNVWVNKTGSTNGFGAYVAFVPEKRFGIAILANKNYPNADRIEIAQRIYKALYR